MRISKPNVSLLILRKSAIQDTNLYRALLGLNNYDYGLFSPIPKIVSSLWVSIVIDFDGANP